MKLIRSLRQRELAAQLTESNVRDFNEPIQIRDVVEFFPNNVDGVISSLFDRDLLMWGEKKFDDHALNDAAGTAHEFAEKLLIDLTFTVKSSLNNKRQDFVFGFYDMRPVEMAPANWTGFSAKKDSLYFGFTGTVVLEQLLQDKVWNHAFLNACHTEYDDSNAEHYEIRREVIDQFRSKGLSGIGRTGFLIAVTKDFACSQADEMVGGFVGAKVKSVRRISAWS